MHSIHRPLGGGFGLFACVFALAACSSDPPGPGTHHEDHDADTPVDDARGTDRGPPPDAPRDALDVARTDQGVGDRPRDGSSDSSKADVGKPEVARPNDADATGPGDGGSFVDPSGCQVTATSPGRPTIVKSAGYAGTVDDYFRLYDVGCSTENNCVTACVQAGGTSESCAAGSECLEGPPPDAGPNVTKHCLPPTYWRGFEALTKVVLEEFEAAETVLDSTGWHDPLITSGFGIRLPEGAIVRGIRFEVTRNTLGEEAVDDSIRVLKGGVPVGDDRREAGPIAKEVHTTQYGGPLDTWGTTWTKADVESPTFGLSMSGKFTSTAGHERLYIKAVRATVFYSVGCP